MRIQGIVKRFDRRLYGHVNAVIKADSQDWQIAPHGYRKAVGLFERRQRALKLTSRKQTIFIGCVPAKIHGGLR